MKTSEEEKPEACDEIDMMYEKPLDKMTKAELIEHLRYAITTNMDHETELEQEYKKELRVETERVRKLQTERNTLQQNSDNQTEKIKKA